ncbi:PCNA-interacting partner isoform X1 [Microcaecilia unicolor]|uniref:PCNA-interacting partner n=1 Tax=Microcaecilia unicolor TaxID=1415580 RepID=A0A6P7Z2S8_9AMPH|nr:PCNA-interacting partner isoform X1 [Microcaecilia unicolor]XP_030071026.1 PCNA-interacting partner isoform X1 [Microcaecilia unicolor]
MTCIQQSVLKMIKCFRRKLTPLTDSERATVCGADDMLLVLQLAMAGVNKQCAGEFTVSLSEVVTTWKYLLHDKLDLNLKEAEIPDKYTDSRRAYDLFLKSSNMLDLIDIYQKCTTLDSETDMELSPIQLLKFISGLSHASEESGFIPAILSTPTRHIQDNVKLSLELKRIICSYLKLMVNSRNDLALACILNVPDRALGRDAFTNLKHASQSKQMSLFLVATSFIRSLELGGKGYAPSESDPLRKHTKGLSDFVHFIDKLDEILEISNPSISAGRILSSIKMHLMKGRSSGDPFCLATMEVVQDLDGRINNIINFQQEAVNTSSTGISPARPKLHAINHGTASCGRETVKALIVLLDEEAASPPNINKAEVLYGQEENEASFGIPSMLTLFRSPEQSTGSSPKSLREHVEKCMDERKVKMKQNLIRSQFACTYKEDHAVHKHFPSLSQAPTCRHPAPKPVSVLCFENESAAVSSYATEDTNLSQAPRSVSGNVHKTAGVHKKGRKTLSTLPERKSSKRKQLDLNRENIDPIETDLAQKTTVKGLKTAMKPAARGKHTKLSAKNRLIPGQGKLTSFFRL